MLKNNYWSKKTNSFKFAHEKLTLNWNYSYISIPKIKTTKNNISNIIFFSNSLVKHSAKEPEIYSPRYPPPPIPIAVICFAQG